MLRRAVAIVLAVWLCAGCANRSKAQQIMLPAGAVLIVVGGALALTADEACTSDEELAMPEACAMREDDSTTAALGYTSIAVGALLFVLGLGPGN
jgi:hypothetical protein